MFRRLLPITALTVATCTNPSPKGLDCQKFLLQQREIMNRIDTNKDGKIDRKEWSPVEQQAFADVETIDKKYNSTSNPDDIRRGFAEYDVDGDGYITSAELNKRVCQR